MVVTKHQQNENIVRILEAERRQMSNNSAFILLLLKIVEKDCGVNGLALD